MALAVAAAATPYLINSRFYFFDDVQHQYLYVTRDMGRLLSTGEWPWLSLELWQAGNYLVEYYVGAMNPLTLLQAWHLYHVADNHLAAFLFALPHILAAGIGTFLLVRRLTGDPRIACLIGFCIAANNYSLYWNAASWHVALVAFAWLPLAWYLVLKAAYSRLYFCLAILCFAHIVSAGSPQGALAAGMLFAMIFVEQGILREWRPMLLTGLVVVLGAALAAPSYFPLAGVIRESARPSGVFNNGFLVPLLSDLLQFANPAYLSRSPFTLPLIPIPSFYAAWFALPMLFFIRWEGIDWRRSGAITGFAGALLFLLAALGPEQIGPIRWPLRFVPYAHMTFLVGLAVLMSQTKCLITFRRIWLVLGMLALQGFMAWQQVPEEWDTHVLVFIFLFVAVRIFAALRNADSDGKSTFFLLGVSLLIFVWTHCNFQDSRGWFQDWEEPRHIVLDSEPTEQEMTYSLYVGNTKFFNMLPGFVDEYKSGSTALAQGIRSVNGYSPIGHLALSRFACFGAKGESCPSLLAKILSREAQTGESYANLFRINRIVVRTQGGKFLPTSWKPEGWHAIAPGQWTQTFLRDKHGPQLPGTVSFASPQVHVEHVELLGTRQEKARLAFDTNFKGGLLVFARLWWPNYQATLNGQPLETFALDDLLVAVRLPATAQNGVLEISYHPRGLREGLLVSGLSLFALLLACMTLFAGASKVRGVA